MFSNLIESGSHRADLKRKGKFFLGATLFYSVLLAATGVGSIYAYNARLDDTSDYEILAVMRFSPSDDRPVQTRHEEPRPASPNNREQQFATRIGVISVNTPYHSDRVAPDSAKDVGARVPVRISNYDSDPASMGGPAHTNYTRGPGGGPGDSIGPAVSGDGTTPPPAHITPTPAPPQHTGPLHLTSTVLTGKAISKPAPP